MLGIIGVAFPGVLLAGVDIEARQLRAARADLARLGLEADLRQADGLELPWPDASFDHVWMMWLLEHLADPVAALHEAVAAVVESTLPTLAQTPGASALQLEAGFAKLRALPTTPNATLGWVVHKAKAVR